MQLKYLCVGLMDQEWISAPGRRRFINGIPPGKCFGRRSSLQLHYRLARYHPDEVPWRGERNDTGQRWRMLH